MKRMADEVQGKQVLRCQQELPGREEDSKQMEQHVQCQKCNKGHDLFGEIARILLWQKTVLRE